MLVMYDMLSCPYVRDDNIHKWYSHCWHPMGGAGGGQLRPAAHLRRASWKLTACAHWSAPHGVYSALYTVHHVVVWTLYTVQSKPGVWFWDYVTRRTDSINYFDSTGARFNSEANPYQSMATCARWQLFIVSSFNRYLIYGSSWI